MKLMITPHMKLDSVARFVAKHRNIANNFEAYNI